MVEKYFKNTPLTKFVLIQDSFVEQGIKLFDYILDYNINLSVSRVLYYLQFTCKPTLNIISPNLKRIYYNKTFIKASQNSTAEIKKLPVKECGIFIDSLAHMIFTFGISETYKLLNDLKSNNMVKQIVTILHTDILENEDNIDLFEHLSTLSMSVQKPKIANKLSRMFISHKSVAGKVVTEMYEYSFEHDRLKTKKVDVVDTKAIVEENMMINPEDLSTFKISLDDKDKVLRDDLVLPYLPKNDDSENRGGAVFYQFDEADDWDEEDPDDDLDI